MPRLIRDSDAKMNVAQPWHQRSANRVVLYSGASLLQGLLMLVSLPIVTGVLGPADYGVYAVVTSIVAIVLAIADLGQNVVLSGHYRALDMREQKVLLTTFLVTSLSTAVLLTIGLFVCWPVLERLVGVEELPSRAVLWWIVIAIPARSLSSSVTQFFVIADKSNCAALLIVTQALMMFVGTLVALFWFKAGMLSLFIGFALGSVAAAAAGIMLAKPMLAWKCRLSWIKKLLRVAPTVVAAGLMDSLRVMLENVLLARSLGAVTVGLYTHAKSYGGVLMQVTNAVAYVLWPRAIDDGKGSGGFVNIGRIWNVVYFWLVVAGIAAVAFSYEMIAILTHGKFVAAAPWVSVFVAYLLLQNSGKAATAVVYGRNRGVWASKIRLGTILVCLVLMWFIVPVYGVQGLFVLLFGEMLAFRIIMGTVANRVQRIPFQDIWVVGGCLTIIVLDIMVLMLELSFIERTWLFVISTSILVWIGRDQVRMSITQARGLVRRNRTVPVRGHGA